MVKIYQKLFFKVKTTGFTLIELLVVVLIIGILAAVALPQYRIAVAKTRLTALIPNVRALKDGLEMYYMANGAYPEDNGSWVDVGFDIAVMRECDKSDTVSFITCPNGIVYDRLDYNEPSVAGMDTNIKLAYVMWLDNSLYPGGVRCIASASDKTANSVCKSIGGVAIKGERYRAVTQKLGSVQVYKL